MREVPERVDAGGVVGCGGEEDELEPDWVNAGEKLEDGGGEDWVGRMP